MNTITNKKPNKTISHRKEEQSKPLPLKGKKVWEALQLLQRNVGHVTDSAKLIQSERL